MTARSFRLLPAPLASILGVVTGLFAFGPIAESQPIPDHQVKAAFFVRFASYIEAPPSPHRSPNSLAMCISGPDPFHGALERLVELQRKSAQRPIAVRHIEFGEPSAQCHFLFLAHDSESGIRAALEQSHRQGTVTVSDFPGFIKIGGMIELFLEGRKVYFKINQIAAESEGIKVSSRVLTLAKELVR